MSILPLLGGAWYNRGMLVKFSVITLFPEALSAYLSTSMMWKANQKGIAEFEMINLRDFGLGPHKSVDDTPYGGGDGMLLRCEPAFAAIEAVKQESPNAKVIIPTPGGELWAQAVAGRFAQEIMQGAKAGQLDKNENNDKAAVAGTIDKNQDDGISLETLVVDKTAKSGEKAQSLAVDKSQNDGTAHYIIFCPHYEGLDVRILSLADYEISLGKYILTGGELPALIMIDSIVRLLPGVLGGAQSAAIESFSDGDNLEYPQYTKPFDFRGMQVPEILLSGNHGAVADWRAENSGTFEG